MRFFRTSSPTRILSPRSVPARVVAGLSIALLAPLATPAIPALAQVPGPELFGIPPKTPLQLWDAIDYLVRTDQAAKAVPYLKQFLESSPDDESLLTIREKYGMGSILRLQDHPETRGMTDLIVPMIGEASRRRAQNPERVNHAIAGLTRTPEEQARALAMLREGGPYAVPTIIQALAKNDLAPADRSLMVRNLGRLDRAAVPPLIAALDSSEPAVVRDAAEILGRIGDRRAIPALTIVATGPGDAAARTAAQQAMERLTGRSFGAQPQSPVRLLTDVARAYHTHAIQFPGDPVMLWTWDKDQQLPVATPYARTEAEALLGTRFVRAALALDPTDHPAQVVLISLTLDKAIEKTGYTKYPASDPEKTFDKAVAAGPVVLTDVLRTAIADGKTDLAAVAASALGKTLDPSALVYDANGRALVTALDAPGRRTRFAAARAIVSLNPKLPFAGSSRVVPTLAHFAAAQPAPRAVIIDGNLSRGGQLSGFLKEIGFEPMLEPTGAEGFRAASETADVEAVFVDVHLVQGDWRLHDTLANLRADVRTAALPIYLVGSLDHEIDLRSIGERFPGVRFLVAPVDSEAFRRQLDYIGKPERLTPEERLGLARDAAGLLARVASEPNSPFASDLPRAEAALTRALNSGEPALNAAAALGNVPDPTAQRSLADILLDPSRASNLRVRAANQLTRSLKRFGPLVAADQEAKIQGILDQETDPAVRSSLEAVMDALRPAQADAPRPTTAPPAPTPPSPGAEPTANPPAAAPAAEPAKEDQS